MKRLLLLTSLLLTIFCATAQATPYYEWGQPVGTPRGTVITIHGGGWAGSVDYTKNAYVEAAGARYRAWGWRTLNVDYRTASAPGHELDGYNDLANFVAAARWDIGNDRPVCVWGGSAGAHYALLLLRNTDLDCALVEAAPTDLPNLPPATKPFADAAFGGLSGFLSPINYTGDYNDPIAMATAQTDTAVPISTQGQPFVNRVNASGRTAIYPLWARGGDCEFSHVRINCADRAAWDQGQHNVLNYAETRR